MSTVVLYGTESGTAELLADDIVKVLGGATVHDMSELDPSDLDPADFHIVVCSTYGTGELPTGAEPFYKLLLEQKPDFSGLRFAVFGLGDKVYGYTFNRGGEIIAEKLTEQGAVDPRDMAKEWAAGIASLTAAAV